MRTRAGVPLELRLGLIDGHWTPLAAQEAIWVIAHAAADGTI